MSIRLTSTACLARTASRCLALVCLLRPTVLPCVRVFAPLSHWSHSFCSSVNFELFFIKRYHFNFYWFALFLLADSALYDNPLVYIPSGTCLGADYAFIKWSANQNSSPASLCFLYHSSLSMALPNHIIFLCVLRYPITFLYFKSPTLFLKTLVSHSPLSSACVCVSHSVSRSPWSFHRFACLSVCLSLNDPPSPCVDVCVSNQNNQIILLALSRNNTIHFVCNRFFKYEEMN